MEDHFDYLRIEKAIRFIRENYQNQPSLDQIADHVHLSKFHFQRLFHEWAGVSPKAFTQYLTIQHAKRLLSRGQSTLQTSLEVGLSGTGRLHDLFVSIEAMRPGQFKEQGDGMLIRYYFYPSPFGEMLVAETEIGICDIHFTSDRAEELQRLKTVWKNALFREEQSPQALAVSRLLNQQIIPENKIRLNLKGTPFQVKVWEALLKIPMGGLLSYADIAEKIQQPKAVRAVGTAIGKNPVAFLIPCHRVIRQSAEIGEYRWGTLRKCALIGWESAQTDPQTEEEI